MQFGGYKSDEEELVDENRSSQPSINNYNMDLQITETTKSKTSPYQNDQASVNKNTQ